MLRTSPRVILRKPRSGRFGEEEVLVLEMGLGGAKFEHPTRLDVSRTSTFTCGPLTTDAVVVHSVLLPAKVGMVYQTGVSFRNVGDRENALLLDLLVYEAKEQVREWESNLSGDEFGRKPSTAGRRSAVALRFVKLQLTNDGWLRSMSIDPDQPEDGLTIVEGTPDNEVAMLCETYERADGSMRDMMRRMATIAVLEQMCQP